MTHVLANVVAFLHLAYALFVILGTVAIVIGPSLGWKWVRNLPFRVLHLMAVYIVLVEEAFGIQCPLNVLQWDLRSAAGGPQEATEGLGGILDGLLYRTIPGWALDVLYWSLGVGLLVLLYVVPPRWRRESAVADVAGKRGTCTTVGAVVARITHIDSRRGLADDELRASADVLASIDEGSQHAGGGTSRMKPKNTICLWFDKDAEAAARFYAATFPDSRVNAVLKAPADYPSGRKGDVLTVEFTVLGIPCLGLNGGPEFKQSEAFSFQIATDSQEETDRYWNAIVGNGGKESQCGWCKDRWGLSWQITPRVLTDALAAGGDEARRAFEAMMPMKKIDVATIEAARRGELVQK